MKTLALALTLMLLVGCQSKVPCSKDLTRPLSECISHKKHRAAPACEVEVKTRKGLSCMSREQLRQVMERL